MQLLVHAFFNDKRVQVALLLVVLDVGLGVLAAVIAGTFRLGWLSDFLRRDVLAKLLPFFLLYAGYKYAAHADVVIPGFNLEVLMNAAWVALAAAIAASILNSLRDLGVLRGAPDAIAGSDVPPPQP